MTDTLTEATKRLARAERSDNQYVSLVAKTQTEYARLVIIDGLLRLHEDDLTFRQKLVLNAELAGIEQRAREIQKRLLDGVDTCHES